MAMPMPQTAHDLWGNQTKTTKYTPMPIGALQQKGFGNPAGFSDQWATVQQKCSQYGDSLRAAPVDTTSTFFTIGQRKRINLIAIMVNVFLPLIMFTMVMGMVSFEFHHQHPMLMYGILLGCLLFVLFLYYQAYAARQNPNVRTPMWWTYAAIFCSTALAAGYCGGMANYSANLASSYTINSLNTYANIDVSADAGGMLMDVGKAYFGTGTHLDFKKVTSFKHVDIYCVVPIMKGTERMQTYDYWAVGKNCCGGELNDASTTFRCGEFNNPKARSGIRLIDDDSRAFYRLAVQQAEGAHHIIAPHPLFFEWVQDPSANLDKGAANGMRIFGGACACFLGVDLLAICIATVAFSKIGRYPNHLPRAK